MKRDIMSWSPGVAARVPSAGEHFHLIGDARPGGIHQVEQRAAQVLGGFLLSPDRRLERSTLLVDRQRLER